MGEFALHDYMADSYSIGGVVHREIFTFPTSNGSEFEDHIFPVMKLMGKFVTECL